MPTVATPEHAWGGGTEHTNMYGGQTAGEAGYGAEHTNVYGGTTAASTARARTTRRRNGTTAYAAPADAALRLPSARHGELLRLAAANRGGGWMPPARRP